MDLSKKITLYFIQFLPVVFYAFFILINSGASFPIFLLAILVVGIINAVKCDKKSYFKTFGLLTLFSVVGEILLMIYYFFCVSSDSETPIIGALFTGIIIFEILLIMGIGLLIRGIKSRKINKKILMTIMVSCVFILLILIVSVHIYYKEPYRRYPEYEVDFFGNELLKELDYKPTQEELEIAEEIVQYSKDIADAKIVNEENIIYQYYSPYSYGGCVKVDLNIEILTCKVDGKEGALWVSVGYKRYDKNDECISYGSVEHSRWHIKQINGSWMVDSMKEHP